MKIEIEIWSTKKGKDGKPFCCIETVFNLHESDIEAKALDEYKKNYTIYDGVEYKARISQTIID